MCFLDNPPKNPLKISQYLHLLPEIGKPFTWNITFFSDTSIVVVIPSFSNSLVTSSNFRVFIVNAACSPASNINTELAASVIILLHTSTYDSRNLLNNYSHPLFLY